MTVSTVMIIGGAGFVGKELCKYFSENATANERYRVVAVDLCPRPAGLKESIEYLQADMTVIEDLDRISKATGAVDIVICLASWGMSGSAMLDPNTRRINVSGIKNIVATCFSHNVTRLIYTSTYNVIYGGQKIENGNETANYFPIENHTDYYASSKAEAEKFVLETNGKKMNSGALFRSAVIRPAAIYGEGEQRHFPRIVRLIDLGLFTFQIGKALVDWVHVENLCQAFGKLSAKLLSIDPITDLSTRNPGGQAYFISDGTPINNFEFLKPITKARGAPFPSLVLSLQFMLKMAYWFERFHLLLKSLGIHMEPFFTRAEVYKVGETHYFSIEKAQRELGYNPTLTSTEGAQRMGKYYRDCINNDNFFRVSDPIWWILIAIGMGLLYHFAFYDVDYAQLAETWAVYAPMMYIKAFSYSIFKTQQNLKYLFYGACFTHLLESFYAVYVSLSVLNCKNTWMLWFLQTVLLGYASLQHLVHREYLMGNITKKN